jgi:hypothetical protein
MPRSSTTVYLNIEAVKAQAPEHLVLQALMVTTMANAISGLYLSVLFADVLEEVRVSYGLTICWVQVRTFVTVLKLYQRIYRGLSHYQHPARRPCSPRLLA